ncbi:MAG TPA: amidohydrolase [Bacteroidales bacterium]|nr:amidohydrolase [Bacteroidales bacterium]HPT02461.1 amidohydrolase [Bacteroidales bacterium]
MDNLSITLIQPDLAWEDKPGNLAKFEGIISKLKTKPDLVILPEAFSTGFVVEPHSVAEEAEGQTFRWMQKISADHGCAITGSCIVKSGDDYYNRLIWMRPDGSSEYYDKRHLFRFGDEHLQFSPGDQRMVVELKGWKIRPLICYDLRFPVWSKNRYFNNSYEYDLLIYVANWPGKRSYAFRQLLIARAIENQSYVIGVNRVGRDGKGTLHQGDSAVLDYRGKPIIEIPPDVEDVETVQLSYEKLHEYREGFKVALDWDDFSIGK